MDLTITEKELEVMIIEISELQKYSGVYLSEDDNSQELYIKSAEEILFSYLGYNPELKEYTKVYDGLGYADLRLGVKNIVEVSKVVIDGEEIDPAEFVIDDDSVVYKNGTFKAGRKNIIVEFVAGFEEIPSIMKMTILRIATLLQLESDNNIGVSSRSFADNTRTFLNTKNYEPYLVQCSRYKLLA